MATILQTLTEISEQMQTFADQEHTSGSPNACIYCFNFRERLDDNEKMIKGWTDYLKII